MISLKDRREQATRNFYNYDVALRGYYFSDTTVDIQPPFKPYYHSYRNNTFDDDSKVPSLLGTFKSFFKKEKNEEEEEEEEEEESISDLVPKYVKEQPKLKGFSFSFKQGSDILLSIKSEFLNMLFVNEPVSFEIIANFETITFQFVSRESDYHITSSHFKAFFPFAYIKEINVFDIGFDFKRDVAIADFGLENETVVPIQQANDFQVDPLTTIIALMDNLQKNDRILFQIIFKPTTAPFVNSLLTMADDGTGNDFFPDSGILSLAKGKTSETLYSSITRIAIQGETKERSSFLAKHLTKNISHISNNGQNSLIPLSNTGYNYQDHLRNVYYRSSNRLGMLLNTAELSTFIHYPNKNVISHKLNPIQSKTKLLPKECIGKKYILGENIHDGEIQNASIDNETFSKHVLVAGGTGTGKTYFLENTLITNDIKLGISTIVIDPHGDLVENILSNISEKDKDRTVYINLAGTEYSFGLNIFSASTEAEKNVLSSDLASAFYETFISSGDRIQGVLQKTISTFVYSERESSLLDMKRFLLEKEFRNEFLNTLDDPLLHYYWENEFTLIKPYELSPLLLRIDNFVQTKLLRNIFAQNKGVDFKELIEQKKVVLINLSVGLIGLQNSIFFSKLLISKINQVAFARQSIRKEFRHPIHLYIDEAQAYANTHSIEQILSGARKVGLSLIQVFQHFDQLENSILNSVLSNTATQVYFRLGDKDAKRVAQTFSYFDVEDFLELERGNALIKVNKRSNDFNLKVITKKTEQQPKYISEYIIQNSQKKYAKPVTEIEELLQNFIPKKRHQREKNEKTHAKKVVKGIEQIEIKKETKTTSKNEIDTEVKNKFLKGTLILEKQREHRLIQSSIKKLGQSLNFLSTVEKQIKDEKRIDVVLENAKHKIAIEVSVTNTAEYEVKNIAKCLAENYYPVIMISNDEKHLIKIKELSKKEFSKKTFTSILFINQSQLTTILKEYTVKQKEHIEIINGIRVVTEFENDEKIDAESIKKSIAKILFKKK